jgi:siroheme synthase-like protein
VNLVVEGRPCLVVGGGPIGARKAAGLAACGARVTLVAPELSGDATALVDAAVLRAERRAYRPGEAAGYWLVVTATDQPAVNQAVYDDAVAAGVWVNSADDPARCTFTLPAVHRQGPVLVTASTGGASPALACWLRDLLASQVGPELAQLADRLAAERARVHASGASTEGRDWTDLIEAELERLRRVPVGPAPSARARPAGGERTCVSGSGAVSFGHSQPEPEVTGEVDHGS